MVSRRKILSRSRDDLNLDQTFSPQEEEEDVWYQKDKLYKEHIQEVLDKWTQIDDEIWAKVIVFERNRRVAKAYARAPVLTINGSDDGFDGMRIGLCGFDNPMRDQKTEELKRHIGQGVKIKMDDAGNILIRRYAKSNVYVKSTASTATEETSIGAEILKLPNQALESEKIVKLFDMKKFQSNVNRELRRAYPDRRRLETQCLSAVAFAKSESDILECPIWVLIVNVVAMDMLKSKLPPVQRPMVDIKNRPRIPIPDEDPYSVAGNGSGGSSGSGSAGFGNNNSHQQSNGGTNIIGGSNANGNMQINNGTNSGHVAATREQLLLQTQQLAHKRSEKPPKLPPRDNIYSHDLIPKPDYDDIDVESRIKLSRGKSDKGKDNKKYDDPYYCGLRARVPNFVKTSKPSKDQHKDHHNGHNVMNTLTQKKTSMIHMPIAAQLHSAPPHMHPHHIQQQQMMAMAAAHAVHHPASAAAHHHHHQMWQTRSYESGIGIYSQMSTTAATNFLLDAHTHPAAHGQPQSLPPLPITTTAAAVGSVAVGADSNANMHAHAHAHGHRRPSKTTTITNAHHQSNAHRQSLPLRSSTGAPVQLQQHHRHHHSRNCMRRQHSQKQASSYIPSHYNDDEQLSRPCVQRRLARSQQRSTTGRDMQTIVSPHRLRSRSGLGVGVGSQIDSNCNCVSCYTLAPLFGAALPARPPRSLSQQQLRQHQRLCGGFEDTPAQLPSSVVKWCSESDISELERNETTTGGSGNYACYEDTRQQQRKNEALNDFDDFDEDDDFDVIFDMDQQGSPEITTEYSGQLSEHKRRDSSKTQRPLARYFNNNNNNNNNSTKNNINNRILQPHARSNGGSGFGFSNFGAIHLHAPRTELDIDDDYVDKTRLRQLIPSSQAAVAAMNARPNLPHHKNLSALLGTRNKSLSTESFFEQPTEEGTLYMYGGRKCVAVKRAPSMASATNIYDRVRNSLTAATATGGNDKSASKNLTYKLNLNGEATTTDSNNNNSNKNNNNSNKDPKETTMSDSQPNLPPPCWRVRRDEYAADQSKNQKNNKNNNKNKIYTRNVTATATATATNKNNLQQQKQLNNKINNNNDTKPHDGTRQVTNSSNSNSTSTATTTTKTTATTAKATLTTATATSPGKDEQNNKSTTQAQHQRHARSASRIDISDMESIYGYLKPRKPRSLSLKKIQILDY